MSTNMMKRATRGRLFPMRLHCDRWENVNLMQSLSHEKRYKGFPFFVGGGWGVGSLRVWAEGPGGV